MNSAPAELLQLLTTAALQPLSPPANWPAGRDEIGVSSAPFTSQTASPRKEKAAMPEQVQAVRLSFCGKFMCISA
jgi:hypothetical protein